MGEFGLPAPEEFCFAKFFPKISSRAERLGFDAISLSFHKEMAKEREPKTPPLETVCAREKVASLSLCSSFRGNR